jgi:uncharacterized protein YndB with AHSA1/START domain
VTLTVERFSATRICVATVDVSQRIEAPADRVWALISEHERMPEWGAPLKRVTLVRTGASDRNGVGAVRRMEAPLQRIEEEIIGWDPPRSYEYTMLRGAPIRDHRGRIDVVSEGSGCVVRWRVSFTPTVPFTGTPMALGLKVAFGRMLSGLKELAERS